MTLTERLVIGGLPQGATCSARWTETQPDDWDVVVQATPETVSAHHASGKRNGHPNRSLT